jgi:hypothetical protein
LVTIEKQGFSHDAVKTLVQRLSRAKNLLVNDIYHLFLGWSGSGLDGDAAGEAKPDFLSVLAAASLTRIRL